MCPVVCTLGYSWCVTENEIAVGYVVHVLSEDEMGMRGFEVGKGVDDAVGWDDGDVLLHQGGDIGEDVLGEGEGRFGDEG